MQCIWVLSPRLSLLCCTLPRRLKPQVLAEVNEDARAVLDQVLKLFKKAGKSKQREISDSLLAITSGDPKSCEQRPAASEE